MNATTAQAEKAPAREQRLLTIGAVCRLLAADFPDISISKIRYLEDQGLLAPKRTQGGYRLFGEDDVDRLETILRLQRDEFLPLRVIRQELAAGKERRRRRPSGLTGVEDEVEAAELAERAGLSAEFLRELDDFGLLSPRADGGERRYGESDVEIATVCAKLARFGVGARHLRQFRTSVDRNVAFLQALVTPSLRSRNPERHQAGLDELQTLGELAQELSQLLLWRELRRTTSP